MLSEADDANWPMWCSNVSCQKRWMPDSPLSLAPVVEPHPQGRRIWHPCPACLEHYGPASELTHALRALTARELSAFER